MRENSCERYSCTLPDVFCISVGFDEATAQSYPLLCSSMNLKLVPEINIQLEYCTVFPNQVIASRIIITLLGKK